MLFFYFVDISAKSLICTFSWTTLIKSLRLSAATQNALPNPAAPQSDNYIVYKKNNYNNIVDVHDFILGWKIVYLSAQHLSFCPYALYKELIIAIDRAFSFRLLCFVKQTPLRTLWCFVHSWSGFLSVILTVFDCCLELGAMPVSSKCGCASRAVCDYILHMYWMRVLDSPQFSSVFTLSC